MDTLPSLRADAIHNSVSKQEVVCIYRGCDCLHLLSAGGFNISFHNKFNICFAHYYWLLADDSSYSYAKLRQLSVAEMINVKVL